MTPHEREIRGAERLRARRRLNAGPVPDDPAERLGMVLEDVRLTFDTDTRWMDVKREGLAVGP